MSSSLCPGKTIDRVCSREPADVYYCRWVVYDIFVFYIFVCTFWYIIQHTLIPFALTVFFAIF